MSTFGGSYSLWKNKINLGIFAVLAFLQVGPRFIELPAIITLISLPVTMIHSLTLGTVISSLSLNIPYVNTIGLLVTTYIFSAILGYIIHSQTGSSI